jgi:tetratricopeptide (TPR) repeat protein
MSLPLDDTEPHPRVDDAGLTFGRYVVRELLGSGGMGIVYRAYDPELQREIALKVLHKGKEGSAERLLGEAQAMARIRHPNVITVYDVGTVAEQVFVAMELFDGMTLERWRRRQRSAEELVRVFRAAGEGLRAAHDVGVVHRDFKPENVLVGDDGRVCVTDFGLASTPSAPSEGQVVGTPAYMAPEQQRGAAVDGKADQFSFCVALFESFYGELPFARGISADATPELERRLRRGAPARVRRVLRRGLALAPAARFADMAELLRLLAPRRHLRRLGLLAVAATVVVTLGFGLPRLRAHAQIDRCRQMESKIATLWSAGRQAQLQEALAQAQLGNAWPAAKLAFDGWTRDWTRLHGETCVLSVRPDAESQSLFDLRMECLNERWQEADETLTRLITQPGAVKHTTRAIAGLQSIDACAEGAALRRGARPTFTPAQLRPIDDLLARAQADFGVENCRESLAEATQAADAARALGAILLESDARGITGLSQLCLGDRDAARVSYIDTAVLAGEVQDDQRMAVAYLQLITVTSDMGRFEDAEQWLQRARETIKVPGASIQTQAELESEACYVPYVRGRPSDAEPYCRRACELYRQLPKRSIIEADALQALGLALGQEGKFAEAAAAYREAQRLFRELNGPDSPDEIRVLGGLASDETEQDHMTTALALLKEVIEHGPTGFPDEQSIHFSAYGFTLLEVGRAKEGLAAFEHSLAIADTIKSEHNYETGAARAGLGSAYVALGRPELALSSLEQARRIIAVEGNEDLIAQIDFDLAKALWSVTPRRVRAIGLARQARDLLRAHPLAALRARHTREVEAWLALHDRP